MDGLKVVGFQDASVVLRAGVYALVKAGEVIYVGQSRSVYQRVYAHRNVASRAAKGKTIPTWLPIKGFVFDEVWVRACRVDELDKLEQQMIDRFRPRFNVGGKPKGPIKAEVRLNVRGVELTLNAGPKMERRA